MSDSLGPRARHVYRVLRERLAQGEYPPESQLPAHTELAAEFRVATLTVRHVLAQLEEDGLISREMGRGTFVRPRPRPAVLIVDDDALARTVLRSYVQKAGYEPILATGPEEGLTLLRRENLRQIALILSDVHMPDKEDGIGFMTTVARRWPEIPLAAVTAHPHDLDELHGTPECPFLIVSKPFQAAQINGLLRLAHHPSAGSFMSTTRDDMGSPKNIT